MDIFVVRKDIKKTFILRVEPTDTILNVKEKIQVVKEEKGVGVALDQQLLTIENDFELEDIRPLSFYCLEDGSSIFLVVGNPLVLAVYFMEQQKELRFQIESGDSVMDLKQRIEQETSIPLKEQQLYALLEDTMPVSDLFGKKSINCWKYK